MFKKFGIKNPAQVINMDECGTCFEKMAFKIFCHGLCHAEQQEEFNLPSILTKGNLNHVTVMAFAVSDGMAYKQFVVFPGLKPH